MVKKVNEKDLEWKPAAHEDVKNPGVWKKVIVRHDEVDPNSKLMMVNLCKIPIGRVHAANSHETMEEVFKGQVILDGEIV